MELAEPVEEVGNAGLRERLFKWPGADLLQRAEVAEDGLLLAGAFRVADDPRHILEELAVQDCAEPAPGGVELLYWRCLVSRCILWVEERGMNALGDTYG